MEEDKGRVVLRAVIKLPPVTKKNSQRIVRNHRTGQMFPIPSKAYQHYEAAAGYFLHGKGKRLSGRYNVKTVFYMSNRQRVDLSNLIEAIHDVLVHYEILADDNYKIIASVDGSRVEVDRDHPRTEIEITEI